MQLIPSYSQSLNDRSSPKAKNRMMSSNQPNQPPNKLIVNSPGMANVESTNKRNNQNKLLFNRNVNPVMSVASTVQKSVNTTGTFIL